MANPEKKVTGMDDPSVAILNVFNFVKTDKGVAKAVRFIVDVNFCPLHTILDAVWIIFEYPEKHIHAFF